MTSRPDLGPQPRLGYAAGGLDRVTERRADAARLAALAGAPESRVYLIGDAVALKKTSGGHDPLFDAAQARRFADGAEMLFLGLSAGAARFALPLGQAALEALKAEPNIDLVDLRSIAVRGLLDAHHLAALAAARALINWHARHRYCSNCGAATRVTEAGWRRDCPSCAALHFPRTDPVVIMLAVAGERCVLGRSHRFQSGMWSCLAGFMEPGETIEEAVRREIREEAGIVCGRVGYFASQPWPFPTSLMIGCHAQATSREIIIDKTELDDARWFERGEVALMLAGAHPQGLTAPTPMAIAHHILRAWVGGEIGFD
jgi:NAD+ diphosphatase